MSQLGDMRSWQICTLIEKKEIKEDFIGNNNKKLNIDDYIVGNRA